LGYQTTAKKKNKKKNISDLGVKEKNVTRKTIIRLDCHKVDDKVIALSRMTSGLGRASISNTLSRYTQNFRNPRSSNMGSIWDKSQVPNLKKMNSMKVETAETRSQIGGAKNGMNLNADLNENNFSERQILGENDGLFRLQTDISGDGSEQSGSRESQSYSKKGDTVSLSQPKQSNLEQIEEYEFDERSSVHTYDDGQLFQFLNRESDIMDDSIMQEAMFDIEKYTECLEDVFLRLNCCLKDKSTFFSKLITHFCAAVTKKFWVNEALDLQEAVSELVDSIKIFSCYLSMAIFKLFEKNKQIFISPSSKPEEVFVSQIVTAIFSIPVALLSQRRNPKLMWYSRKNEKNVILVGKIIDLAMTSLHKSASEDFMAGKDTMISMGIHLLPDLLKLDSSSLEKANKIVNGDEKKPEFMMTAVKINPVKTKIFKPYGRCIQMLNSLRRSICNNSRRIISNCSEFID